MGRGAQTRTESWWDAAGSGGRGRGREWVMMGLALGSCRVPGAGLGGSIGSWGWVGGRTLPVAGWSHVSPVRIVLASIVTHPPSPSCPCGCDDDDDDD